MDHRQDVWPDDLDTRSVIQKSLVGTFPTRAYAGQGGVSDLDGGVLNNPHGERVFFTDYPSRGGDSGGPVLINDGAGHVWAAGIHVGRVITPYGSYAAFISIDDLLARFGAWLPVFAKIAAPAATSDTGAELPQLNALSYVLQ